MRPNLTLQNHSAKIYTTWFHNSSRIRRSSARAFLLTAGRGKAGHQFRRRRPPIPGRSSARRRLRRHEESTTAPERPDELGSSIRETDMFSHVRAKIRPWLPAPVLGLWRIFRNLRDSVPRFLDGPHVLSFGKQKTGGLICDVGLCDGGDTAFFLAKGFRQAQVEYFLPTDIAKARVWLSAP